jgi:hypothetical protein
MTRSTWHNGLILDGSLPISLTAVLIAAKSTTAGTPVKSYKITLAGLNGISTFYGAFFSQSRIVSISASKFMVKNL